MKKIFEILTDIVSEAKRFQFEPEVYLNLATLTEKLWSLRNKKFVGKTLVDSFPFKTSDGVDGFVKVVVNPKLKYIGYMETRPKGSRDPMDFVMELQPKEFISKKNLFLTIYHEMLHATDPSQSTKESPSYLLTYDEKSDEKYWGHPIEFRAITNEFLEGLVLEFERRKQNLKNSENIKYLKNTLTNIKNYFAKNETLSKLSLDILDRINDENVLDDRISKLVSEMPTNFPGVSEFMTKSEDEPYYLTYVELIKKYNPEIWKRFLTMLYNTVEEIDSFLV